MANNLGYILISIAILLIKSNKLLTAKKDPGYVRFALIESPIALRLTLRYNWYIIVRILQTMAWHMWVMMFMISFPDLGLIDICNSFPFCKSNECLPTKRIYG